MAKRTCSIETCNEPVHAKGMCNVHYIRVKRKGDPHLVYRIRGDDLARFYSYTDRPDDGCWTWQGALNIKGYGIWRMDGRSHPVYQWVYRFFIGPVPDGLELDHVCHSRDLSCPGGKDCPHRRCVNPAHLEPVTHQENCRRGRVGDVQKARTHCPQGHEYTPENTRWVNSTRDGRYRACRTCSRANGKRHYWRNR